MTNVKPNHYNQGKTDLIESWYNLFPKEEFRAIMKSHIMKYVFRYDKKNGDEDLDKAIEYIHRLKDYEQGKTQAMKRERDGKEWKIMLALYDKLKAYKKIKKHIKEDEEEGAIGRAEMFKQSLPKYEKELQELWNEAINTTD